MKGFFLSKIKHRKLYRKRTHNPPPPMTIKKEKQKCKIHTQKYENYFEERINLVFVELFELKFTNQYTFLTFCLFTTNP